MREKTGKREAHKRATRVALQEAADRLFAEQGVRATTVREIAEVAGVNERTFFRYFAGKYELAVPGVLAWTDELAGTIRRRPEEEPPILAVERALTELELAGPFPLLFTDDPPVGQRRLGPGLVALMMEAELRLAEALSPRVRAPEGADRDLAAAVTARCVVAAARSAAIRDRQLRVSGASPRPTLAGHVEAAFATLRHLDPES